MQNNDINPRTGIIAFIILILLGCLAENWHPSRPHICTDSQHIECLQECGCKAEKCPK